MLKVPPLHLNGLDVADLYCLEGLRRIDGKFITWLNTQAPELAAFLLQMRQAPKDIDDLRYSQWLCQTAPHLEAFLADVFHLEDQRMQRVAMAASEHPIVQFKQHFVLKEGKKRMRQLAQGPSWESLEAWRLATVAQIKDQEWAMARFAVACLTDPERHQQALHNLYWWCAHMLVNPQPWIQNWVSFKIPKKLDFDRLIPVQTSAFDQSAWAIVPEQRRQRQGFDWTDQTWSLRALHGETHYCLFCHEKSGDFCRTGFPQKKGDPSIGLRQNPLSSWLVGCPLDQKISEMNLLASKGHALAALATLMIDNPMCVLTGQRICNECMKACIYQKQTPVDIPKIESTLLKEILRWPWGVELYALLVQWNPLRREQFLPEPFQGSRVAIMGMGPAGMTMAHHLLMAGCAVVGLDGQAIQPPPSAWQRPIHRYEDLEHHLSHRPIYGVGGVSEYGITARWDKNLITLAYLTLMRRAHFQCYGSVRFGGTWTLEDAWRQQFDHVVIALGAGLPKTLNVGNSMAVGMRTANDFLMALHLGGAGHPKASLGLEVHLPAVVIGGGLTAVDTATELQALYLQQVAQAHQQKQQHIAIWPQLKAHFSAASWRKIERWCQHGAELAAAKKHAMLTQTPLDLHALLQGWGGVTILYRKRLQDSPAYRINHEELHAAFQEGILYRPCVQPQKIMVDAQGEVCGVMVHPMRLDEAGVWHETVDATIIDAQSIWSAIGTQLNVAYSFEHPGQLDKSNHFQYAAHTWHADSGLQAASPGLHCKTTTLALFTQVTVKAGVSFIGDSHPAFHGSVVKAMGSAKRGYPEIVARLQHHQKASLSGRAYQAFVETLQALFVTRLVSQTWAAEDVVTWQVHAPAIAQAWQPGTLCRWQPKASHVEGHISPPIFMTPIAVDPARGMVTVCHVVSDVVCRQALNAVKIGARLDLMGPTGVRLSLPTQPTPVLFFVQRAWMPTLMAVLAPLHQAGHRVYVVVHDGPNPVGQTLLEAHTEKWIMAGVAEGGWSAMPHQQTYWSQLAHWLDGVTLGAVYGLVQPKMLQILAEQVSVHTESKRPAWLAQNAKVMGQAMGAMQCGLKGVCAQCLQWQVDPQTGQRTKAVYGCSWQNQPLADLDIQHMAARQRLNGLCLDLQHAIAAQNPQ